MDEHERSKYPPVEVAIPNQQHTAGLLRPRRLAYFPDPRSGAVWLPPVDLDEVEQLAADLYQRVVLDEMLPDTMQTREYASTVISSHLEGRWPGLFQVVLEPPIPGRPAANLRIYPQRRDPARSMLLGDRSYSLREQLQTLLDKHGAAAINCGGTLYTVDQIVALAEGRTS